MRQIVFSVLIFLISSLSLAYTPAEGNVTATFGPYLYENNFKPTSSGATSPKLAGVGLIVLGDMNDHGSLEIAMFKLNKLYFRDEGLKAIVEEKEIIHITMGYRWWHSPYVSTSLSFFSSYSMGDPKIIHSDFAPGTEIDTSARDTTEYGFDGALHADLWDNDIWAVIAEVRYSLSVTSKKNEKSDHYGMMLGLRYLIQDKVRVNQPDSPAKQ